MKKNNTTNWVLGLGVVVLVVVVFFIIKNNQVMTSDITATTTSSIVDTGTTTDTTTIASSQDANPVTGFVAAASVSYENALIKYADRRIQLDLACQAHPNNVTYKDNTGIMIDNRSPQTRTVKIGTTFTIKPWGFKIVILPDIYLKDKTLLVDCGSSQNVATILVQE